MIYHIEYLTYNAACTTYIGSIPNCVCNVAYNGGISYKGIYIDCDLVHYWVVYAYVYAYYVVKLLLYNIHRSGCYNNGLVCVNKDNITYQVYNIACNTDGTYCINTV